MLVYERSRLSPEMKIEGPAIIEEVESTCLIEPESRAKVDEFLSIVLEIGSQMESRISAIEFGIL